MSQDGFRWFKMVSGLLPAVAFYGEHLITWCFGKDSYDAS